ncbi:hypothetical protein WG66_014876 [Moniliophthora roreri]|nr:hypothetical protein WG66_014876 [Moniliophthora roreri]
MNRLMNRVFIFQYYGKEFDGGGFIEAVLRPPGTYGLHRISKDKNGLGMAGGTINDFHASTPGKNYLRLSFPDVVVVVT